MKGVAQTSNISHINGKKNNRSNDKLSPKAKFKTGTCTSDKKIRKNKMFSSSDNISVSIMSLSSEEIHLLAELTVDFTVLQILLQVTNKTISKLCMGISNTF